MFNRQADDAFSLVLPTDITQSLRVRSANISQRFAPFSRTCCADGFGSRLADHQPDQPTDDQKCAEDGNTGNEQFTAFAIVHGFPSYLATAMGDTCGWSSPRPS